MMLDPKATFDDLIDTYSEDAESRDRVLDNRIYRQISGALAGSQEYMAMEKLYELHTEGDYDLLILDTPPSRNALDFLDAPQRVTQFIEGRAMRLFIRPTGFGARVAGRGFGVVTSVLRRVTGGDLIADLSEFFSAMAGLLGGFRDRADRVEGLLRDAGDHLPRRHGAGGRADRGGRLPAREARRGRSGARRADRQSGPPARRARTTAPTAQREALAALSRKRGGVGDAESGGTDRRRGRQPPHARRPGPAGTSRSSPSKAEGVPLFEVPELSDEIHDIEGLTALGRHLFGD